MRIRLLVAACLALCGSAFAQSVSFSPPATTGPSVDLNFAAGFYYQNGVAGNGVVTNYLSTTRASIGTAVDSSGNWTQFANNVPRVTNLGLLVEESRTNSIRNNTMQGAVVGTPGTLPTNWTIGNASGLSTSVIGTGAMNGVAYVDLRFFGTSSGTFIALFPDSSTTTIAAVQGQIWTHSFFLALVAGSLTNVGTFESDIQEANSGGTILTSNVANIASPTASLVRATSGGITLSQATTAFVRPRVGINISNTAAIDFTLRIGWPQLELGSFATSPIPTTNAAVTRAADVVATSNAIAIGSAYTAFAAGTPEAPTSFATNQLLATVNDGASTNRSTLLRTASTGAAAVGTSGTSGSIGHFSWNGGTIDISPVLAQNSLAKGASTFTGASGLNAMSIGDRPDGTLQWNGTISRVALWPTVALPNVQLQSVTQ